MADAPPPRPFAEVPLMSAAFAGADGAELQRLIDSGEPVHEKDANQEMTALHLACCARGKDNVSGVQVLLDAWPESLEALDCMENTPLTMAASNGNPQVCRLLIDAKANVNHTNCMGDDVMAALNSSRINGLTENVDEVAQILTNAP